MSETSPAQRRRRAIRLLQQVSEEITEAHLNYQATVNSHESVARALVATVGSEVAGNVLAPMLTGSVEWTGEAYVELERILGDSIELLRSTLTKNVNRASRDNRKIATIRAQIIRLEKSHAETVRRVESQHGELVLVKSRLASVRAELDEREQSFLSFLRKKDALRLEIGHLETAETRLSLELNSLEEQRSLIEQDRDGTDRVAAITALENQLQVSSVEKAQLEHQIADFERCTSSFLTQPYDEQMQAMREEFESSQKRLTVAVRRISVLATKRRDGQSFVGWIAECDLKRSTVIALINAATKTLSEDEAKLQAKLSDSVVKSKERELERQQKAKKRRQAVREARQREAERRAQANERRRLAAERRRQEGVSRSRMPRSQTLRPGEPDLNELRNRFRRS